MLINGQALEYLPVSDRALHYGDGVFETIRVRDKTPLLWERHLARLLLSCNRLRIPLAVDELSHEVVQVLDANQGPGILKIIVSRGSGGRGYTPPVAPAVTRILQLHPLPAAYDDNAVAGVRAMVCRHPISTNRALAGIKHLNRLDQVMASMELSDGVSEGLMCDEAGLLIEGIKSNIFLVTGQQITTPDLTSCGVAGIMRAYVMDILGSMKIRVTIRDVPLTEVSEAGEIFICNSVIGIWPVTSITMADGEWRSTTCQRTRAIQALLRNAL